MTTPRISLVLNHLRRVANLQADSEVPDQQLLERYITGRDEEAFTALVRRHGPMVAGVCRRMLAEADAEDAYQATFLVLARKAGSIRKRDSLGSWLHGVAMRVARKARLQAARQARGERGRPAPQVAVVSDNITWGELRSVLDEELSKLSAAWRAPLILCYLEGQTQDEAARQLGWSKSTLRRRLEHGRRALRGRLTRRGVTLSAGLFATLLSEHAAAAIMPMASATAMVKTALSFAAGPFIARELATNSVALAESVLQAMAVAKGKLLATVVLTLSLLVGAGLCAYQAALEKPPVTQDAKSPAEERGQAKPAIRDPVDQFGDPLPPEALARLGTIRLQHGNIVWAIVFAPDGRSFASAGGDSIVHIWETATGKELLRIENRGFELLGMGTTVALAYAPDGKTLAGARINQPSCLWDVATGKELRQFGGQQYRADWVEFSPDGKILAYGGSRKDQSVRLADVNTAKDLHQFGDYKGHMTRVKFSPDGKILASADDLGLLLFEITAGKVRDLPRAEGQGSRLNRLTFSPDGSILATTNHENKQIQLLQIPSGKALRTITLAGKREEVGPIQFSTDGNMLISGHEDGLVRFWDVASGAKSRQLRAYADRVADLALSPDGSTLATSRWSPIFGDHGAHLWQTATGKPLLRRPGPKQGILFLTFSPDSRHVATASGDEATILWEASTGKLLQEWKGFGPLAFTPDGRSLVRAGWSDGTVFVIDLATGKETRQFATGESGIARLHLSRDGKRLAMAGNLLRLWDLSAGRPIQDFGKQKNSVINLALSPDGRLMASVHHQEHTVRLWDTASGKLIREHREPYYVNSTAFSPDAKLLAYTCSGTIGVPPSIRLRDLATGVEVRQLKGVGNPLDAIAFSPDGRTLIWGGHGQPDLYYFEVATGELRRRFSGHQGQVGCVAFSPNGRLMASGSSDASVLIWDVTGERSRLRPAQALSAVQLDQLWADLAGNDAAVAYQAVCALQASPRQAVPLLARHLKPVARADAKRIADALANLGSDRFAARDKAAKDLESFGEAAEAALRQALVEKPSLEVRRRVVQLLERLGGANLLRRSRALEVVEHIGDPEAHRLLTVLANGAPPALLTMEARAALDRLK